VSGMDFPVEEGARRPGDPAILVASNRRIQEVLGWQPRYDDLEFIVETAWQWEQWLEARGGPDALAAAAESAGTAQLNATGTRGPGSARRG
jgi:hypothetical protein